MARIEHRAQMHPAGAPRRSFAGRSTAGDKLLIVNADDLGRTPGINAGVFEAHDRGLVTSATLMVNFPAAEAAARGAAERPGLGIGLHVELTGGVPSLPPEQVPSLVDAEGRLPRWPEGLAGADPGEVLAEVRSQLDRFRQLTGRLPTHLDSHHHSHRRRLVLEALVTVAREEGLPGSGLPGSGLPGSGLPVRNASPEVGERLRRAGVATPDAFVETFFGAEATLETLLDILAGLGPGVTEVMCHPARIDEELRASSTYVDERERELAVLTHPEARRTMRELGIRLVHFGAL